MSLTIVITGAGSGFGKGAALALSARGHHVIATTETEAQAAALRAEAPQLQVEKLDITNASDIKKVDSWNIDVLLNNAGAGQTGPMADVPMDRVRFLYEVNVFGTIAITQAELPQMEKRVLAGPAFGPYSMTKHALEAFGKSLRAEMAVQGIDVTLLNPGPYNTGFNDRMADSMWEWFNEASVNAPATELHQTMRQMVTTNQMDPIEVVNRMVELVEASTTTENNFVPEGIIELLTAQVAEA